MGSCVPFAVLAEVLEVAGAHEPAGLLAVEDLALGRGHVEARVRVTNRSVEPERHPADRVDQLLEPDEVDLDVVVDRDVEVVLDRVDQRLHAMGVGGVDALRLARAGDREVEVAREGEDVGLLRLGIDPEHHDRVGAVAPGVAEEAAGIRVRGIDAFAAVGAHQQEVGRLARRDRSQVDVLDPARSART